MLIFKPYLICFLDHTEFDVCFVLFSISAGSISAKVILSFFMSVHCGKPLKPQTFQSSAALVKLTGVCDTFSDSTDEDEVPSPSPVTGSPPQKNDGDSPSWVTTSWKSDSGFNSDVGCGANLEQDDQDQQVLDLRGVNALERTQHPETRGSSSQVVSNAVDGEQENNQMPNCMTDQARENRSNHVTHSQEKDPTTVENSRVFQFVAPVIKPFLDSGEVKSPIGTSKSSQTGSWPGNSPHSQYFGTVERPSKQGFLNTANRQTSNFAKDHRTAISRSIFEKSPPRNNVSSHERTNPFNKVPLIDDGHFEQKRVQTVGSSQRTDENSSRNSSSLPNSNDHELRSSEGKRFSFKQHPGF